MPLAFFLMPNDSTTGRTGQAGAFDFRGLPARAIGTFAGDQSGEAFGLSLVSANVGLVVYRRGMKPELLAAAYLLQRLHGAAFAAGLLEEHGIPRANALRLLADRPRENLSPVGSVSDQYPNQVANLRNQK